MLLKKKTKGYVSIPNGKVDITDPCYNKGDWCQKTDVIIKPGEYRCRYYVGADLEQFEIDEITEWCKESNHPRKVELAAHGLEEHYTVEQIESKRKDIQNRCFVIELQLKGRSFQLDSPKWEEIGQIGVDAGLAGFFWNKPDFDDDGWNRFCDDMDSKKGIAWIDENMGYWSESGYGDGGYAIYAIKENNEIIALKICF